MQTEAFVKRALHQPAVENIHIVAESLEPAWAQVDGDIVNDHPTDTLTNAQTYIVLFDSAGHVVGVNRGSCSQRFRRGRVRTTAQASALRQYRREGDAAAVSIVPSYKAPGSAMRWCLWSQRSLRRARSRSPGTPTPIR